MGKMKDLFKKISDIKGTFYAKVGIIKNRNSLDLREAEDIKKTWQEYTEELYKKKSLQIRSVAQSCPTLRPHESQHARHPRPSPTPGVH